MVEIFVDLFLKISLFNVDGVISAELLHHLDSACHVCAAHIPRNVQHAALL